jgi:amidase
MRGVVRIACFCCAFPLLACSGSEDEKGANSSGGSGGPGGSSGSGGAGGAGAAGDSGLPSLDPADYLDRTLREQVAVMEAKQLTAAGLTAAYLGRIESRDRGSSGLRAVLAVDPEAEADAALLDEKRGSGALLQGAVILVKDNIDSEGLATTAGSTALANNVPDADAPSIAKLRAANGVVLGKTNLSEWANFRGFRSSSGWSSVGGQTLNGADSAYNPCGSSSGSGAAVAAGMASAALGTETDGSIVCPASVNGVVGFKPTVGLVSRTGVVPISHTQDTIGPMTKDVGDAARVLSVIAGPDPADPATAEIPASLDLDFEAALEGASLSGKRLGVGGPGPFPLAVRDLFDAQLARIEAAGAEIVPITLPSPAAYGNDEFTVLLYEFKPDLNAYLASHARSGQPQTLAELIAFNEANAAVVMPFFGQEIFEQAEATTGLAAPEYLTAKDNARRAALDDGIVALMATSNLDAILAPTASYAWVTDHANGDPPIAASSGLAAVAGCPHLTVPMGEVNGLPVGLSIFAGRWQDGEVLALGYAYEQLPP